LQGPQHGGHTMGTWGYQLPPHWFLTSRLRSDSMVQHNEKLSVSLFNCHRPCPSALENDLLGLHQGGHTMGTLGCQLPPHWVLLRRWRQCSMMVHNENVICVSVQLSKALSSSLGNVLQGPRHGGHTMGTWGCQLPWPKP